MKVLKNYFYNAVYQVFRVLIPFITIPYLSRILGPKGIGINSYTNSVIEYFCLLGDLGISIYGNRKIAYIRSDKYKLTQTFYEIMILQVFTTAFSYFSFLIFLVFTGRYQSFYLAQSILIISWAFDISWFFMGIENFKVTVLRNFIAQVIIVICIFIFVKSYSDLLLYMILSGSAFLVGNITLFISLPKYIGFPNFKDLNVWHHLWPSIELFIPTIATQVYLILNKTMLGLLKGTDDAGFYDQSDKVVKMILAIVTATGTVMLPHVAHAFANGHKNITHKYLCDSFSFVTALSIAMAFGLAAITPVFVPLFFGNTFNVIIPLMMIESIVIILIAWSNVIGIQYLLPTKQTTQFTISVIIGSLINILINIPFIIFFGVVGSVIATVLSELSVTCYQLYAIRGQISFRLLFKDWYKYLISGIIMFLIVLWLSSLLSLSWIAMLFEVSIGAIIYMILIFIMRTDVFNIIRRMIHSDY